MYVAIEKMCIFRRRKTIQHYPLKQVEKENRISLHIKKTSNKDNRKKKISTNRSILHYQVICWKNNVRAPQIPVQ